MSERGVEALAAAVRQRRGTLRLAQGDLKALGGPGVVTVGQVERAAIASPQERTLAGLDKALGWVEGSAAAVLAGGEPTVAGRNPQAGAEVLSQPVGLGLDAAADGLTPEEIEPVLAVVRAIKRAKGLDT